MNEWILTGKVIKSFVSEGKGDKQTFLSLTLSWQDYVGMKEGKAEFGPVYVDAIAFGKMAESMEKVPKGSVIQVVGKPRVSRVFETSKGHAASLQVMVASWSYVPRPSDGTEASSSTSTTEPSDTSSDDDVSPFN